MERLSPRFEQPDLPIREILDRSPMLLASQVARPENVGAAVHPFERGIMLCSVTHEDEMRSALCRPFRN